MPTSTFFNLDPAKRERLLQAARGEFTCVPFTKASINHIIQAAGIPRGSFYMYFSDKEDLFCYLIQTYADEILEFLSRLLEQEKGDLFSAFRTMFSVVSQVRDRPETLEFQRILGSNAGVQQGILLRCIGSLDIPPAVKERIDQSRLSLQSEAELEDMLHILINVTLPSLCAVFFQEDVEEVKSHFFRQLSILQRGMEAPAPRA